MQTPADINMCTPSPSYILKHTASRKRKKYTIYILGVNTLYKIFKSSLKEKEV